MRLLASGQLSRHFEHDPTATATRHSHLRVGPLARLERRPCLLVPPLRLRRPVRVYLHAACLQVGRCIGRWRIIVVLADCSAWRPVAVDPTDEHRRPLKQTGPSGVVVGSGRVVSAAAGEEQHHVAEVS